MPAPNGSPRIRRSSRSGIDGRARNGNGRAGRPLRFAVIGLGHISQVAVLPAFRHAAGAAELTGLISSDPIKRKALSRRYRVSNAWSYDDYDEALGSDTFDAVYIALPNHLHREYAVRAARAGKHVLCEKPMALSVGDCEAMTEAARDHDVRLMVAYRLHFDPVNLEAVKLARSGRLGDLLAFESSFGMKVRPGNIRVRRETGGGTLWDIGIYCINAARYLFGDEPVEASAWTVSRAHPHFEVEQIAAGTLRFPGARLARFWTSFVSTDIATYSLVGEKGHLRVENAYEYHEPMQTTLTIGSKITRRKHPIHDQFAAELVHFADCVRRGVDPVPSGEEGRADVAIIDALYKSARSGKPVRLDPAAPPKRPDPRMAMSLPPVRTKPRTVRAPSPHPS